MQMKGPKLSPARGSWPKSEKKRAIKRYLIKASGACKEAITREAGLNRSRGAASKGIELDTNSPEFAEIASRYK